MACVIILFQTGVVGRPVCHKKSWHGSLSFVGASQAFGRGSLLKIETLTYFSIPSLRFNLKIFTHRHIVQCKSLAINKLRPYISREIFDAPIQPFRTSLTIKLLEVAVDKVIFLSERMQAIN